MPAAAEVAGLVTGPVTGPVTVLAGGTSDLQGPVPYADRWLVLALVALAVVVAYYALVVWLGRTRPPEAVPTASLGVREAHLARIDRVERDVRDGVLSLRAGYQELSETVRSYVETVSPIRASTMALTELRRHGPPDLADTIALMYPPEFAPGDPEADARGRQHLGEALSRARWLVTSWA